MYKILVNLTNLVKEYMPDLEICEKVMAEIDFHFAKARYAVKIQAVEPELSENRDIYFENMKHPLLLTCCKNVISNNFEIGQNYHSVIITGSNTGGKTVTLKTIGLFILMAKRDCFYLALMQNFIHSKKFLQILEMPKIFCKVFQRFHHT